MKVKNVNTVETRYNGFEGTREFWLLNPNVVKSNYHFLVICLWKENKVKSNKCIYVLNELQWLAICAISKHSKRFTDAAFDMPVFIYS